MGIPIILSLYLKPLSASMPCFIAANSVPKTNVSTVDCFFENNAPMQCSHILKKHFLICDIHFLLHEHYPQTYGCLPPCLGSGLFMGIASLASL